MTNKEKYNLTSEFIINNAVCASPWCCEFTRKHILKRDDCGFINCHDCNAAFTLWLDEEVKEKPVDWSKVEQGTIIEVSNDEKDWFKKKFVTIYNGVIYTENTYANYIVSWKYGRLINV